MKRLALAEQVEHVAKLEDALAAARKETAGAIRKVRAECHLSLRQLQPLVHLSLQPLSALERGESWKTETARRVARVLDERCA